MIRKGERNTHYKIVGWSTKAYLIAASLWAENGPAELDQRVFNLGTSSQLDISCHSQYEVSCTFQFDVI